VANSVRLSKEEYTREILKCGRDPVHFISHYVYTKHPTRGNILLKLYPFQEDIIRNYQKHRFNIILKARQLGVSTITSAYSLWLMLFHQGKQVLTVATKLDKAIPLVKKVKAMYKKLPEWLKISESVTNNIQSFELDNGSEIRASASSDDVGRCEALSFLVIDEAAHIVNLEELWMGLFSTLSTGGNCVMLSTPKGAQGLFYKTFIDAENQINDFFPSVYIWSVHPERDQKWFDKETRNMSKKQINQELLCSFLMSGETVLDPEDIEWMEKNHVREPLLKTGFDRNLWIWEEYINGAIYVISADCSRGDGKDFSTAQVMKINEKNIDIVAEYQGKPTPDIFSNFLYNLGIQYGSCLMVIENNSMGIAVLEKLIDKKYPNLYYSEKTTHEYVESYEAEVRENVIAGFTTSNKTRPLVISKFEEFIRNRLIFFHSRRMINECRTFIWNASSKAEAQRGYCDDLVLACAIGCFVRDIVYETSSIDLAYKKAFLSSFICSSITFDTKIPGQMEVSKQVINQEQRKMYQDYAWVLRK